MLCAHGTRLHFSVACSILHCNTLQHAATHCNTLQHTAVRASQPHAQHCNTLQRTGVREIYPRALRLLAEEANSSSILESAALSSAFFLRFFSGLSFPPEISPLNAFTVPMCHICITCASECITYAEYEGRKIRLCVQCVIARHMCARKTRMCPSDAYVYTKIKCVSFFYICVFLSCAYV